MKFGVFGTNRSVRNRGVGIIEAGIGWSSVSLEPIELSVIERFLQGEVRPHFADDVNIPYKIDDLNLSK